MLPLIFNSLNIHNANYSKYHEKDHYSNFDITNVSKITINGTLVNQIILDKLFKYEYTYSELELLYKDTFEKMGLIFNGYTLKDYFPEFEKTRRTKKGVKDTYYKFKL